MEIHVSVSGDDAHAGTSNAPLQSIAAAQEAVRKVEGGEPVSVIFHDGTYYLDHTLVFRDQDSGTEQAPATYRALNEGKVVFSGGVTLELEWRPYRNGIMRASVPQVPGLDTIDQLYVDGNRRPMARYPDYDADVRPFNGVASDAMSPERVARWANPAGGFIHAIHALHWGGFHYRITGKTPDNTLLYEGGWQNHRPNGMHPDLRCVENIFEELDAPGEWFWDAEQRTLYYYPMSGEDAAAATFVVSRLRHLVEFQGSQASPVKHVSLEGIVFRHAERTFMETKEPLLRSDWTIYRGGAVVFDGAEDCAIVDCEFDSVGGNAVFVNMYNRRVAVRGTHIHGAGASGVCFVGDHDAVRSPVRAFDVWPHEADIDKTPGPKTDNYPADCVVEDCLIHDIGVVEKQATGVQISMSRRITVRHCSIYDTPRAGINIGDGCWGGHVLEFCDVFDTVLETGDHGSFNSWGRDRFWGLQDCRDEDVPDLALLDAVDPTIIRNTRWRCDHGWDVDLDDGSSNYHIYNNLFLHGGLKLREGFHRVARNNIMVNNGLHPHVWYDNSGDVVTENIFMTTYQPAGGMPGEKWGKEIDRNLFVSEADRATYSDHGCDANSIVGDPMFIDPASGDFRVKESSSALNVGFENIPMDRFGVQKPALKSIAKTPEFPVVQPFSEDAFAPLNRDVTRWQGAELRALAGMEYSAFGVSKDAGGIQVLAVADGSVAADIGLKQGDLMTTLNRAPAMSTDELTNLQPQSSGQTLVIGIQRGRSRLELRMEV